jgi:hypothetical protein
VSDDKIIPFPTNRIVERSTAGPVKDEKTAKRLRDQQTKQFVETAVDDISMNLLRQLYDLSVKTDKYTFTKDLAIVVDMIRGLIYRDFDMKHPTQVLSDTIVSLNINKNGEQSAKIDYSKVLNVNDKSQKPLSKDFKNELKDLNDQAGLFEGDDLDD